MAEQKQTRIIVLVLILAALAGAGAYLFLTRPVEEPIRPAATRSTDAAPREVAPRPEARLAEPTGLADNPPLTLEALQYLPEKAQVAVGIPSVVSLLNQMASLVQDIAGNEMDVAEELSYIARDLAADMGVEESDDLAVVLAAMGLDSSKGAAVFLDLEELTQEALDSVSAQASSPNLPDMSATKAIMVIPVNDAEKAEASLKKLTSDMLAGVATSEEAVGDIVITAYEGIGAYFVTDAVLAVGSDIEMLKQAAAREQAPARLRYGSDICPPDDVNEAVMLIYGDKFVPVLEGLADLVAEVQPMALFYVRAQIDRLKEMYEGDIVDPLLITLSVRDNIVELKSKIDTDAYPSVLQSMGTAKPLHWPQMLPDNTLAFLTLSLTPEAKTQIKDVYLKNIPDEMRNSPGVSQGLQFGTPALDMLGQEITLAITGMDPIDFPSIFLIIEVANRAQASIFLSMAPQLPHGEPHRNIQIQAVNFPSPIQFYFAMIGEAIVLSNSDVGIRGMIDLALDEKTSGFFESLDPPINPETPVYQALMLKPELYMDLVSPLLALSGQSAPREYDDVASTVSSLFSDIRLFNEMDGSWLTTRISLVRADN